MYVLVGLALAPENKGRWYVSFAGNLTYNIFSSDPETILPHLFEGFDKSFAGNVKKGDIIIAGDNFGCGSSREQPVLGMKAVGVQAVVAKGYARIFYRAAINQGLLLVECADAVDAFKEGDEVKLDTEAGSITVGDKSFSFPKLPPEILAIRDAGGLLPYTVRALEKK